MYVEWPSHFQVIFRTVRQLLWFNMHHVCFLNFWVSYLYKYSVGQMKTYALSTVIIEGGMWKSTWIIVEWWMKIYTYWKNKTKSFTKRKKMWMNWMRNALVFLVGLTLAFLVFVLYPDETRPGLLFDFEDPYILKSRRSKSKSPI